MKRIYLVLLPSLVAYVGSLFLPALEFKQHLPVMGLEVLAWGWWGCLLLNNPAWLANPAFVVALGSFRVGNYRRAKIASFWAVLLGLMAFFAREWWFNEGSGIPIARLGPAFYLWIASFCILLAGSLWLSASNAALNPDAPEIDLGPLEP